MTGECSLALQQEEEGCSQQDCGEDSEQETEEAAVIDNPTVRARFTELADVYVSYSEQVAQAKSMLSSLIGDSCERGTLWKLVDRYGLHNNNNDENECSLHHEGKVWSIVRSNNKYKWNLVDAAELFHLAYVCSKSEDGSDQQNQAFDQFQCLLEKLLDEGVVLSDDMWWTIIDDAAELFTTAVIRVVDEQILDSLRGDLSDLFVRALSEEADPEYELQYCDENREQESRCKTVMCKGCNNTVDDEDFFCRHCGEALGTE